MDNIKKKTVVIKLPPRAPMTQRELDWLATKHNILNPIFRAQPRIKIHLQEVP